MTHSFSRRGSHPRDKAHDRLFHIGLCPLRRIDFIGATNLPNHDHRVSVRIIIKELQNIDMLEPVNGIAANAHGRGLAKTHLGDLANRLIG